MRLSTRSRYGVRLMTRLALNHGKGATLMRDISRVEGISEKYLGQIIIPLRGAGLVSGRRGAGGGYTLSGGFWVGTAAATLDYHVYLPSVLK